LGNWDFDLKITFGEFIGSCAEEIRTRLLVPGRGFFSSPPSSILYLIWNGVIGDRDKGCVHILQEEKVYFYDPSSPAAHSVLILGKLKEDERNDSLLIIESRQSRLIKGSESRD